MACEEVVQADPRWQEAMRRRGVEDFSLAMVDPWASSYTGPGRRPVRAPDRAAADVGALRRRASTATRGRSRAWSARSTSTRWRSSRSTTTASSPLPPQPGNYEPSAMVSSRTTCRRSSAARDDLKPIEITQPEGAELHRRRATHVAGRSGSVRIGFTPREGLVLHQVGYDGPRRSSTAPRSAEMYVPYGDPAPTHRFKNVFDQGEYGVGWLANSLDARLRLRRATSTTSTASSTTRTASRSMIPNADLHARGGRGHRLEAHGLPHRGRRGAAAAAAGDLDDRHRGQLRVRVLLVPLHRRHDRVRGQAHRRDLDRRARRRASGPRTARWSPPASTAPHHQHFFCVRLDMAVDGNANTVVEVDSCRCRPGRRTRTGNAWETKPHGARRRGEARGADRPAARRASGGSRTPSKDVRAGRRRSPTSSMPGENVAPMFAPDSRFAQRAGFTPSTSSGSRRTTRRSASPRATTPTSTRAATALPALRGRRTAPLEDTDVVLWYTFGAHHVVRPEDWPVMPVTHVGFKLKPTGFFDGNPALDMPPSKAAGCCHP